PGRDLPGPVALGAAGSKTRDRNKKKEESTTSRLVVFGNTDFISNQYFPQQGNSNLLLNSISWLTQQESMISIRPRTAEFTPLYLKAVDKRNIILLAVIIPPVIVLIAGFFALINKNR
ncbi:MAG: hypothetical protein ACLFQV_11335, partial [Vulcanimicrobiota bacterium]